MDLLYKKLHNSNRGQTLLFVLISIMNITIAGVFTKLMIEIKKIQDVTATVSRDEELLMYFSMLIVVSLMIILFSLWIMQIICRTIFETRKDFNIQLRLMGITRKKLSRIYIKEFFYYQLLVIPIGLILMEGIYYFISKMLDISSNWIGPVNLGIAIVIHLLIVFICTGFTFGRITKFNPLEEMRSPYKTDKIRKLNHNDIITGIIGVVLLVIGIVDTNTNDIFSFFPIIGIFLNFDLIMVSTQYLLKFLAGIFRSEALNIGQRSLLGYYKKINPIITTLTVGIMISIGLLGMFETMRMIAKETVEQNIYFEELIVHSDLKEQWSQEQYELAANEIDSSAEISYGINLEMLDTEKIVNTIYAIDSSYLQYGEKVNLVDGTDPALNLNDADFDGIYLPDYFISDEDIGKAYELTMNGNTVTFKIAGRFIANGSRGRYGFVSKSYLQSVIGNEMVNALYIHRANNELIDVLKNSENIIEKYTVTKKDIANNSYENAISGVEIFEISAFMVIVISMLMFMHFSLSTAKQNIFDISRLRAMGVRKIVLRKAYIYQVVCIFTSSFILGSILAYMFIKVGINMSLEFIDVSVTVNFPVYVLLLIYILLTVLGVAVVCFSTNKAFQENISRNLTVSE